MYKKGVANGIVSSSSVRSRRFWSLDISFEVFESAFHPIIRRYFEKYVLFSLFYIFKVLRYSAFPHFSTFQRLVRKIRRTCDFFKDQKKSSLAMSLGSVFVIVGIKVSLLGIFLQILSYGWLTLPNRAFSLHIFQYIENNGEDSLSSKDGYILPEERRGEVLIQGRV